MYVLGVMNAFGRGMARDEETARRWLAQAVEHQVEAARPVLARLEKSLEAKPMDVKQRESDPRAAEPSLEARAQVEKYRHEN
jgi:TPR repeat protein